MNFARHLRKRLVGKVCHAGFVPFNLIKNGLTWYGFIVAGGILALISGIGWVIQDIWNKARRVEDNRKYILGKPLVYQLLGIGLIAFGAVLNLLCISLITPIIVGIGQITIVIKIRNNTYGKINKDCVTHWYDGLIYVLCVDPYLIGLRRKVVDHIPKDSDVIDICCGPGTLVFGLAERCKSVVGIDLSSKMLRYAKQRKEREHIENVDFIRANAADLGIFEDDKFDYATVVFGLHELPREIVVSMLKEAKRIAKRALIVDYMTPLPINKYGLIARYLEINGGAVHFREFLQYNKKKTLESLLKDAGLQIEREQKETKLGLRIVSVKTKEEIKES